MIFTQRGRPGGSSGESAGDSFGASGMRSSSFARHDVFVKTQCLEYDGALVPRLWNDTIDTHRRAVREAVLDATAELVSQQGVRGVTMAAIAEAAGIGRATLYKYFPDLEAILLAWHERHVAARLERLSVIVQTADDPVEGLRAVLEAYAFSQRHAAELPELHATEHASQARQQLLEFVRDLLANAIAAGDLRDDVPPEELAAYCLHALGAARMLRSKEAVQRLVAVTLAGLSKDDVSSPASIRPDS